MVTPRAPPRHAWKASLGSNSGDLGKDLCAIMGASRSLNHEIWLQECITIFKQIHTTAIDTISYAISHVIYDCYKKPVLAMEREARFLWEPSQEIDLPIQKTNRHEENPSRIPEENLGS